MKRKASARPVRVLLLACHFMVLHATRKELIQRLIADGYDVLVSLPPSPQNERLAAMGCRVVESPIDRRGTNPWRDARLLGHYLRLIARTQPRVVLTYTIKPNLYGSIASRILGRPVFVNITGTGSLFLQEGLRARLLRGLYRLSSRLASRVYFQNTEDLARFSGRREGLNRKHFLLPGSGVNLQQFEPSPLPPRPPTRFLFAGRIMGLKGIDEFLDCARRAKATGLSAQFIVAGFIEEEPYRRALEQDCESGAIEFLGFVEDIRPLLTSCHCVVLPSHGGEGVPNSVLEASALGRIAIGTDIPGTNSAIMAGSTGLLSRPGDAANLFDRIREVTDMTSEALDEMCGRARSHVARSFDRRTVVHEYMSAIGNEAGHS